MAKKDGAGRDGRSGPEDVPPCARRKDRRWVIESAAKRWTDEAEDKFIDVLAASANVKLACAAAGFSKVAVYRRRQTDPIFAQRWDGALAQAYARIELALARRAEALLEGEPPDPDTPIPEMNVRDAIALLNHHRASVHGGEGHRRNWRARPRSLAEVGESILRKMDAIEAMPAEDEDED